MSISIFNEAKHHCVHFLWFFTWQRIFKVLCSLAFEDNSNLLHISSCFMSPTMFGLLSLTFLLLCSFGIVALQFLLSRLWIASKTSNADSVSDNNQDYIVLTCNGESSLVLKFLNLVLSVIFVLPRTALALKTLYVPKNYNESKYIAITLCSTCVAWALFFPD